MTVIDICEDHHALLVNYKYIIITLGYSVKYRIPGKI